jgi:hypothetical protein
MTTPQFVEMSIVGLRSPRLVNVNGIKAVSPSREGQRVEVELWGSEEEPWLRVLVEGSYEDWCARLGVRRASQVDGQELKEAVSRFGQGVQR